MLGFLLYHRWGHSMFGVLPWKHRFQWLIVGRKMMFWLTELMYQLFNLRHWLFMLLIWVEDVGHINLWFVMLLTFYVFDLV